MIVSIEAFLRNSLRVFDPKDWMRRLLRLPDTKGSVAKPGLVMIQIDGLSFIQFKRAMKNGNMPFLSRLEQKEGYKNYRHYSGIPSNTPAVQGMLFYGVKACVPAFSFRESKTGKILNMFNPESASLIENEIKDKGEPLLKEGSAYGNIFTGGAKEAHFCASSMGWGGLLKAIQPLGLPLTIMLHLHIFIRAIFLVGVEIILAIVDSIRGMLAGKNFISEIGYIPLRVAVCVLLREVIAAGAQIDIARGLPVIHMNLAGFDEQAHHRGPSSLFAHWSLRGIDSTIAKVWKAAQRSQDRHYEVFVYSDHGQENTVSYQELYGASVEEAIKRVLADKILPEAWQTEFSREAPYWRADLLRNKPSKRYQDDSLDKKEIVSRTIVTTLGPLGHIYPPEALSSEQKERIASELVATAMIPIVVMPYGPDKALAWNADGKFILPDQGDKVIGSTHPFFNEIIRDIVELSHHPDAGELLIMGWKTGSKSMTFHGEHGSHAGPGPEETSGFALMPLGSLPRTDQETVCTQDIRDAAFRAQERMPEITAAGSSDLRVMTYNVHGCKGRDGQITPGRIARIIARYQPDIIALQELSTNEHVHQAQVIAQKLSMTFHYHPTLSLKKGQRGNAIISKYPMRLIRNGSLPRLPRAPYLEPRAALWVEVDVNGVKVQVINTHLSLSPRERLLQIRALMGADWLGDRDCLAPMILCGDFNASTNSAIFKDLGSVLDNVCLGRRALKTLPSFCPVGLVDHIFIDATLNTTKIFVPKTQLEKIASDHLPLIADLKLGSL